MDNNILKISKSMGMTQNITIRVLDEISGKVIQEHTSHNTATNSLLTGIGHYLTGDGVFEQGYFMLSDYVPKYISLGTMGLISQEEDAEGWPAGIGVVVPDAGTDETYKALLDALEAAKADLESAKEALAGECPYYLENGECYTGDECQNCADRIADKKAALEEAKLAYDQAYQAVMTYSEEQRFTDYMDQRPGYGADGYDVNLNHNRSWFGLGKVFVDRPDKDKTINCELTSKSFPRALISFRDVVPEVEAELPKTIDVVFSALISTGALKQFREPGKDYIFITETGLWSKPDWPMDIDMSNPSEYKWDDQTRDYECGDNGLLAAYRLAPPNKENWDMTVPENRDILKRQILRVGVNQVVQIIWKIQIGSIDQLASGKQGVEVEKLVVTNNGKYEADEGFAYNPVEVNIPTVTSKPLTVTSNGEYVAPEGEAYTPVTVDLPVEELSVTDNGVFDDPNKFYWPVRVDVPKPAGSITITENGDVDVTDYVTANVNVPQPSGSINITANGTVDVTQYESAVVAVPSSATGTINITENGEYDVSSYANASVNIPSLTWRYV